MSDRHVPGDRLSAFLDDELSEPAAAAATRHLDACGVCRGELDGLRATRDALRRLPHLQAPVLTAGVDRRANRSRPVRVARALAVVAAVPVIVLGAAYALGDDRGGVEPPTDLFLVEHLSRTGGGAVPAPFGDR